MRSSERSEVELTHRVWKFRPPRGAKPNSNEPIRALASGRSCFASTPGYQGNDLLRPTEPGGWWLTIDRWDSAANFEAFTEVFGNSTGALDTELEGIAGEEEFVGTFEG